MIGHLSNHDHMEPAAAGAGFEHHLEEPMTWLTRVLADLVNGLSELVLILTLLSLALGAAAWLAGPINKTKEGGR